MKHSEESILLVILLLQLCIHAVEDVEWTQEARDIYTSNMGDKQRLYDLLFTEREYKKDLSPVYTEQSFNVSEHIVPRFQVNVSLLFGKLLQLHAQEQQMYMLYEVMLQWKDLRLSWNESEYGGLTRLFIRQEDIWIPENAPFDSQEISDVHPEYRKTAVIHSDGRIWMSSVYYAKTVCNMNLRVFPFDIQNCTLKYSVYTYQYHEVSSSGTVSTDYPIAMGGNGEFTLEGVTTQLVEVDGEEFHFEMLEFYFIFKRYPHFYIYVIVLPCFILTFLSIVGMFWTENVKEEQLSKLSIGLTSLMSMTVLLDMVSQEIPKTTTFPLLGFYVIICVAIIALACVVLVTVRSKAIDKLPEKEPRTFWKKLHRKILSRHFSLLLAFNAMNIVNFVVLMSFW